jgi:hypothetical protein
MGRSTISKQAPQHESCTLAASAHRDHWSPSTCSNEARRCGGRPRIQARLQSRTAVPERAIGFCLAPSTVPLRLRSFGFRRTINDSDRSSLQHSTCRYASCLFRSGTSIDGGVLGEPEVKYNGYLSNAYPARPSSKEVMALVWSVERVSSLVEALDDLLGWFRIEIAVISGLTRPSR